MNPNLIEKLRCYIEFNEDEERFIGSVFKLKHGGKSSNSGEERVKFSPSSFPPLVLVNWHA